MHYSNPENSPSLTDLFSLKNKYSLIIGGSGLLGSEICFALAELGSNLIIAGRNIDKCKNIKNKIKNNFNDINVSCCKVDISDISSINSLFDFVKKSTKENLNVLVNSGTSNKKNNLDSISFEDWNYDIDVALSGVFRTIKVFMPLLKNTRGNILNIASMYGHIAPDYRIYDSSKFTNPPSYGAAKAGIIQLTKYLSSFLSEHNIRVNSISPGPFPYKITQDENPEFIKRLSYKNPLNRIGIPYEIKGVVALLCSNAGSYITGQNLCVDGGWSIW